MRISDAYPSNYLKAADLQGKTVRVVISHVIIDEIGDERKPVLFFQNKEKGMVLNKTNSNNISVLYGDETDEWAGHEIVLYEAMVDFQGRTVPAIRVRAPQAKDKPLRAPPAPAPRPPVQHSDEDPAAGMDDQEVPF